MKRAAGLLAFFVAACVTDREPQTNADLVSATDVVLQIKKELRRFDADNVSIPAPGKHTCGGNLKFQILSVQVVLSTISDSTNATDDGLSIPVAGVTIGPTLSLSKEQKTTQTTTFTLYRYDDPFVASLRHVHPGQENEVLAVVPNLLRDGWIGRRGSNPTLGSPPSEPTRKPVPSPTPVPTATPEPFPTNSGEVEANRPELEQAQPKIQFVGAPIAETLKRLRSSLVAASDAQPCFTFDTIDDDPTKQGNTAEFGFNIIRIGKLGSTFKFLLFSLGGSHTMQRTVGNTIKVTFAGVAQTSAPPGDGSSFVPG